MCSSHGSLLSLCRLMRHLYLLLLLAAAAAAITEEMEIEGLETLVALSAPKSEEEADNTKARLTFFDDVNEIPIPLPNPEILRAIVETSEPILIQLPYLSKVSGVLTAGQSIQSTPWGTETNNDEKLALSAEVTMPPPVEIGSELDMEETSPFLPGDSLLTDLPVLAPPPPPPPPLPEVKKEEGKMSTEDMERARVLMTALRAMKSEVEETLRQINEGEKTVLNLDLNTVSPSTIALPSTTTTSAPSTTTIQTTTTTTTVPSSTTSSTIASTTTTTSPPPSTTTRRPLPVDEVKSTEAVQIDSEGGEVKTKVIPNNDAVIIVDNTTNKSSRRLVGYTRTSSKVVDNDRRTKVSKGPHDNSFLPTEESETRPKKVLPKKRHLIGNDEEVAVVKRIKKRLRKRVKKLMTSSPITSTSSLTSTTTTPIPIPSTTASPPPPPPPVPSATSRRFVAPRAAISQAPQQFQVSPAAVHPVQLQLPVVARAAPIYHPEYYGTLSPYPFGDQRQQQYYPPSPQPSLQPNPFQPLQQPLLPQFQPQQTILRYEPVVYYRPIYGRKKREARKSRHQFLFEKEQKEVLVKKAEESRFSRFHSVISPSLSSVRKKKHERVFEKREEKVVVRKANEGETKNLPKSPVLRKSSSEPHLRTNRVKRGADLSEVNRELNEIERALSGHTMPIQIGEREERHTGVDELASELEMIEKMKKRGKEDIEEADLMEDEEDLDGEEEKEIPEKEQEEKATPNYKKIPIEELKSLEDSVQVDHEQMKKHPQGELRLNKGERPKLFSHGRKITEHIRGNMDVGDYEYDAQIADSFALPASDNELEELYHARLRAAELAPVSPTASPLRRRRHRTTPSTRDEVEVEAATRRPRRRTTTTETPTSTRSHRRTRRPATIIPNFHPKEASTDTATMASLPNFPSDDEETTTLRARALRRNRHTHELATTTEAPETTTRRGRPARVLPKKELSFALPAGDNRLFYDRDSASQFVTHSPPIAPPTLTPPTLIPQQSIPTISPALSIDELAVLPREALLAELKRLSEQLEEKLEETEEKVTVSPPSRDEDIVDEEDRELRDAIAIGENNNDPFEFVRGRKDTTPSTTTTTTTVATTTEKEQPDLFAFALPPKKNGERLTVEDLDVSDAVNEASIGQELDQILTDVGVGDNSVGTRKRAIEAIMEFKKKKHGDSKAKKCQPTSCTEEKIPKDDLELVSQLQAVNMKHPLAKERKFSLFATNKKSYYILPDGRVLVVNEQSKLARTNSGEELNLDEESSEDSVAEYEPDQSPYSTTSAPPTTTQRRRTTTTTEAPTPSTTTKKRVRTRPPTTTTTFPIEGSDYEESEIESATIPIRTKAPPLPPYLPPKDTPEMKMIVIPWRTTTSIPISTTTRKIFIHDGGIEPSQVSVFAIPRTPPKSTIAVHKDESKKHFPRHQDLGIARTSILGARTLENDLTTTEEEMTREELIKYLESIDLAKTFGGKSIDEQTPNDDKFEKAVTKTAEDEYSDDVEYEDVVAEQERKPAVSSQVNAGPTSVDDIDLRKWFTIGKDSAAERAKKGDGIAESILEAASEVPDEEVAEDEFLAEESVNLFPDDFVRVLRSVAGGERVPMRMLRRLGLRLRAARLRRH
ncbi:hypothetical protein PRIPAC_91109 [Pristionchus pacificus]|uniref:Uncharacterized protein n=1 Tax=Pristionchus pacificus TaxID=54126 RepID=A0A2A6B913_PRIPA|nr:hypothetical protein PRIPAC_91109 [Pristionchus pacificus]|eukprot:PDM62358.1 hypothetical protein PRIPAC_51800 [Pristionchus pacificus]